MLLSFVQIAHADIGTLVYKVNRVIINPLIVMLFAIAIVVFLIGIVEFLGNADNEEKRSKGKQHMIWGIIGLFIMVSVFAIMQLIVNTIGADVDLQN